MKPNFALKLSHDGIRLLHRTARGWLVLGDVQLDDPALSETLGYLRTTALGLEPHGMRTKLLIPNSEIRYTEIKAPGPTEEDRQTQLREGLDGLTPYAVDELVFDWSGSGTRLQVAAVARETLQEAEDFARKHRLNPLCFAATPETGTFTGEPFFGESSIAASVLPDGATLERDTQPVRIVGHAELPDAPASDAEDAGPAPDPAKGRKATKAGAAASTGKTPDPAASPSDKAAPDTAAPASPAANGGTGNTGDVAPGFTSRRKPAERTGTGTPAPKAARAPAPPKPAAPPRDAAKSPVRRLLSRLNADRTDTVVARADPAPPSETGAGRISLRLPPQATANGSGDDKPAKAPADAAARQPLAGEGGTSSEAEAMTVFGARRSQVRAAAARRRWALGGLVVLLVAAGAAWGGYHWWQTRQDAAAVVPQAPAEDAASGPDGAEIAEAVPEQPEPDGESPAPDAPEGPRPAQAPDADAQAAAPGPEQAPTPERTAPVAPADTPETAPGSDGRDFGIEDALNEALAPATTDAPDPQQTDPQQTDPGTETVAAAGPTVESSAPQPPDPTRADRLRALRTRLGDPAVPSLDAIGLPEAPGSRPDRPAALLPPPPFGTTYELNARGLVVPTPEGALSPQGLRIVEGAPPVTPAPRQEALPGAVPVSGTDDPTVGAIRPRPRPEGAPDTAPEDAPDADAAQTPPDGDDQAARDTTTGSTIDLATTPPERPDELADVAETATSALAAARTPRPVRRPAGFADSEAVRQARAAAEPAQGTPLASVPSDQPTLPATASVARAATQGDAINLRDMNLIGVFGTESDRRALVRLANGQMRRVGVGDRLDGGRVAAIGAAELRYIKNGRSMVLRVGEES